MALRSSSGDMEASISLLDASAVIERLCSGTAPRTKRVSDGVCATIACADTHRLLNIHNEDLPVADATSARGFSNRLDHVVDQAVLHDYFDLHLRQEVDDVFGAAIELRVPFLAPEAFHLGDGDAGNARLVKRVLHVVELERLDDGF